MILDDWSIRARLDEADPTLRLVIEPFCERTVLYGMSYGLSSCGYDLRIKDAITLAPGAFACVTTVERLEIPHDVRATAADKSTWARRGLAVQNTRFEPGWRGYPTLELSNHGPYVLSIPAGAPITQMEFALLIHPTTKPYSGKYQDQPQRPVEALDEVSS